MPVVHNDAVVVSDVELSGSVKIGARTVVHPRAKLIAQGGPIEIGEDNIIEELVTIVNKRSEPLRIGQGNRIACAVTLDSVAAIGNYNTIEAKVSLGPNVTVGNDSILSTGLSLDDGAQVASQVVLYGKGQVRALDDAAAKANRTFHASHLASVTDLLPRFHHRLGSDKA